MNYAPIMMVVWTVCGVVCEPVIDRYIDIGITPGSQRLQREALCR